MRVGHAVLGAVCAGVGVVVVVSGDAGGEEDEEGEEGEQGLGEEVGNDGGLHFFFFLSYFDCCFSPPETI